MPQKGFTVLLDAFKIVLDSEVKGKAPFLVAISDGGYKNRMVRITKELGIDKHVHFLPFVDNVAPSIKGFDVVVMPSLWESAPLLSMETMVSGIPLIGTDVPGLNESLENTPSVVVPPDEANSLASAIINDMENPRKNIAEEYRNQAIIRFDVKKQAKQLEELYVNTINRSR
jgi:glycosyltransferase involved in cell wall biosynthesis